MPRLKPPEISVLIKKITDERDVSYLGPPELHKVTCTVPWQCKAGHKWEKSVRQMLASPKKTNGCRICYLRPLDKTGELETRLSALDTELVGDWLGAKRKNRFRCKLCQTVRKEYGLCVTNYGNRCPNCFPRKNSGRKSVQVFPPAAAIALASPPG